MKKPKTNGARRESAEIRITACSRAGRTKKPKTLSHVTWSSLTEMPKERELVLRYII